MSRSILVGYSTSHSPLYAAENKKTYQYFNRVYSIDFYMTDEFVRRVCHFGRLDQRR